MPLKGVRMTTRRASNGTYGVKFEIDEGLGYNLKCEVERCLNDLLASIEKAIKEEEE